MSTKRKDMDLSPVKRITRKRALNDLSSIPHGLVPGAAGAKLLQRLDRASPAMLEWYLQTALTDPLVSLEDRARMIERILVIHSRLDEGQRRVVDSRGMQRLYDPEGEIEDDGVPETAEEIAAMEALADSLRENRETSYEDRVKESDRLREEARQAAVAAAAAGESGDDQG